MSRWRTPAVRGVLALLMLVCAAAAGAQTPTAPTNLVAAPGHSRVTLTWTAVSGATSYRIYRSTTGTFSSSHIATVTTTSFTNTGLVNGQQYWYRVVARNSAGTSPPSATVTVVPVARPAPPVVTAVAGDRQVTLSWALVPTATEYRVLRRIASLSYFPTPVAVVAPPLSTAVDNTGLENGVDYYYVVLAVNGSGPTASKEVTALTEAAPLVIDAETRAAFRLLQQSTWGPRSGDVDHVKTIGAAAFLDEQFAAAPSTYPEALLRREPAAVQNHFIDLAMNGADQLRQRVAWALHKIWVVSAVDAEVAYGMTAYQGLLLQHAFGNYRELMEAMTLSPAIGSYLSMVNNRSRAVAGAAPNENFARELMQLFTIGTVRLNADGTRALDANGQSIPTYTQGDVGELSRILTGWTFGDGDLSTTPYFQAPPNYTVPMELVAAFHDAGAKQLLGQSFPEGGQAASEMRRALDILFNHPNVGPFVATQLIRQLVTSNPSTSYVRDVAAVFADNGEGVRGDLGAVVRAILLHPEASAGTTSGKLSEPLLFVLSVVRTLNATVNNYMSLVDSAEKMGQRILFAPTVFSYFSPGFRVRGTTGGDGSWLAGPEFQILHGASALERANFIARVVASLFGSNLVFDDTPFTSRARDAVALVDYCNLVVMGGQLTSQQRTEMIAAVRRIPSPYVEERSSTALYLSLIIAQSQVDR